MTETLTCPKCLGELKKRRHATGRDYYECADCGYLDTISGVVDNYPTLTPSQQALLAVYADLDHLSSLGLINEHQRLTVSGQRVHAALEAGTHIRKETT